jgi:hypothetical protein
MKSKKIWDECRMMAAFETIICIKQRDQQSERRDWNEQKRDEPITIQPIVWVRGEAKQTARPRNSWGEEHDYINNINHDGL